jgi:murein L,D-transpeptidase YcbB/YkuD
MSRTLTHWRQVTTLVVATTVGVSGCTARPTQAEVDELRAALAHTLQATDPPHAAEDGKRGKRAWQEVRKVYKANNEQLIWSDGRRPRGALDALLQSLRAAELDGLDAAEYHVDELAAARDAFDRARAADLDVRATYAYLRYAFDLAHGTIDPEDVMRGWHAAPRKIDTKTLIDAAGTNNVDASLARLAPTAAQYQGLKHQLAAHRAAGNAAAVEQIAMNMERWRWLPPELGPRYLLVNIPAFQIDAIENGKSVLAMRVVTGKKENPTPVLTDEITSVVFSPYWNIPADIVEKEILPKLETDPAYLERNNMEVDESGQRYRQRPGPGNSLGQVKFVFPNNYNVYLHGTPSQKLFDRVERDFSHGCVRLERPLDLAKYVLQDQTEWTEARIVTAMNSGTEQPVALKRPLPIYLVYFTAWEEGGALRTVPDVYGIDRRHDKATVVGP